MTEEVERTVVFRAPEQQNSRRLRIGAVELSCVGKVCAISRVGYCPTRSILLATFTPLSPFTYFAIPR